jgi:hypothetical protein
MAHLLYYNLLQNFDYVKQHSIIKNKRGLLLTGFMPRKPRFVSGVKRHVSEKNKLNSGKPRLVGGELYLC